MTYGNIEAIKEKLKKYKSLKDETILDSMDSIDIIIKGELRKNNITPPDSDGTLDKAANYMVRADIIDSLRDGAETRSATSVAYDKKGYSLIEAYIESINRTGEGSPYTRSNTDMSWYDNRRKSGFYR